MTLTEIRSNLCYYDIRNPEITVDKETAKEIAMNNTKCYCDNCFNGKTELGKELLRMYKIIHNLR